MSDESEPSGGRGVRNVALLDLTTMTPEALARAESIRIRGDLLANPNGGPDDIVLAAGTLLITSPVPRIGFRQLIVVGSLLAPEESEAVLGPALTTVGDVIWYTAPPRVFTGKDTFSAA